MTNPPLIAPSTTPSPEPTKPPPLSPATPTPQITPTASPSPSQSASPPLPPAFNDTVIYNFGAIVNCSSPFQTMFYSWNQSATTEQYYEGLALNIDMYQQLAARWVVSDGAAVGCPQYDLLYNNFNIISQLSAGLINIDDSLAPAARTVLGVTTTASAFEYAVTYVQDLNMTIESCEPFSPVELNNPACALLAKLRFSYNGTDYDGEPEWPSYARELAGGGAYSETCDVFGETPFKFPAGIFGYQPATCVVTLSQENATCPSACPSGKCARLRVQCSTPWPSALPNGTGSFVLIDFYDNSTFLNAQTMPIIAFEVNDGSVWQNVSFFNSTNPDYPCTRPFLVDRNNFTFPQCCPDDYTNEIAASTPATVLRNSGIQDLLCPFQRELLLAPGALDNTDVGITLALPPGKRIATAAFTLAAYFGSAHTAAFGAQAYAQGDTPSQWFLALYASNSPALFVPTSSYTTGECGEYLPTCYGIHHGPPPTRRVTGRASPSAFEQYEACAIYTAFPTNYTGTDRHTHDSITRPFTEACPTLVDDYGTDFDSNPNTVQPGDVFAVNFLMIYQAGRVNADLQYFDATYPDETGPLNWTLTFAGLYADDRIYIGEIDLTLCGLNATGGINFTDCSDLTVAVRHCINGEAGVASCECEGCARYVGSNVLIDDGSVLRRQHFESHSKSQSTSRSDSSSDSDSRSTSHSDSHSQAQTHGRDVHGATQAAEHARRDTVARGHVGAVEPQPVCARLSGHLSRQPEHRRRHCDGGGQRLQRADPRGRVHVEPARVAQRRPDRLPEIQRLQ